MELYQESKVHMSYCNHIAKQNVNHMSAHSQFMWKSIDLCRKEAYSELCQTSQMEDFAKIAQGFQPLTIFTKPFILDISRLPNTSLISYNMNHMLTCTTFIDICIDIWFILLNMIPFVSIWDLILTRDKSLSNKPAYKILLKIKKI